MAEDDANAPSPPSFEMVVEGFQVRNATIVAFTAHGINCADDPSLRSFQVETAIRFGLDDKAQNSPEIIDNLKRQYRSWIISTCFRDQMDILSYFLEQIYLYIKIEGKTINVGPNRALVKNLRRFNAKNVFDKISILEKEYGISPKNIINLQAMNSLRRSLVHRGGFVTQDDCNEGDHLILKWLGWRIDKFVDGDYVPISDDFRGSAFQEGDKGRAIVVEKELKFKMGTYIYLKLSDVADLSSTFSSIIKAIAEAARPIVRPF